MFLGRWSCHVLEAARRSGGEVADAEEGDGGIMFKSVLSVVIFR